MKALITILALSTVVLTSIPAKADPPKGVSCHKQRSVVTATASSEHHAKGACLSKLLAKGEAIYGSSFWGLQQESRWCDHDGPEYINGKKNPADWICICSAYVCGYVNFYKAPEGLGKSWQMAPQSHRHFDLPNIQMRRPPSHFHR